MATVYLIWLIVTLSLVFVRDVTSFLVVTPSSSSSSSSSRTSIISLTRHHHWKRRESPTSVLSAYLGTNFEWLAEERYNQPAYQNVDWIDPSSSNEESTTTTSRDNDDTSIVLTVPIYPIPALYLPHGNHTLNNVEPRNLKMAMDLNATTSEANKMFVVTVAAADTGRISRIGTLVKMTDLEPTYDPNDGTTLKRVTVYCQAVGIVEIRDILNPEAASRQQRLLRSSEYLKGQVALVKEDASSSDIVFPRETISNMVRDFNLIKTMYELGIWSHEMPPKALSNLANAMPTWTDDDSLMSAESTNKIWQLAQIWQSICLTIREGRQQLLNSDRNEFMVAAVSRKGGPLKLPIHMEDLEPHDRRSLQELEVTAQREFWKLEMDPCLDFLAMMSLTTHEERLNWLAQLISRERNRLEVAAQDYRPVEEITEEEIQPRPGAWFDDNVW